jgi:hypothetical protein
MSRREFALEQAPHEFGQVRAGDADDADTASSGGGCDGGDGGVGGHISGKARREQ